MQKSLKTMAATVLACVLLLSAYITPAFADEDYSQINADNAEIEIEKNAIVSPDTESPPGVEDSTQMQESASAPAEEPKSEPKLTLWPISYYHIDSNYVDMGDLPVNLAEVALIELSAEDNTEFPIGSDSIKYNEWFYDGYVVNPYNDGQYEERYNWNVTFISWCADQLAYVALANFPKTSDGGELYMWLLDHNAMSYSLPEVASNAEILKPGDLIFFPETYGFTVAIVTNASDGTITYIQADVDNTLMQLSSEASAFPVGTTFLRSTIMDERLTAFGSFLIRELGLNAAAASGVLANIRCESSFSPYSLGDGGTSFGICQWHNSRWDRLVRFCNENHLEWETLNGQLWYLKYELEQIYPELLKILQNCPDNVYGAFEAGYEFCVRFERPAAMEVAGEYRGNLAANVMYPTLTGAR